MEIQTAPLADNTRDIFIKPFNPLTILSSKEDKRFETLCTVAIKDVKVWR
jgi:hypothetical protein